MILQEIYGLLRLLIPKKHNQQRESYSSNIQEES
jgi:hypothetical protein